MKHLFLRKTHLIKLSMSMFIILLSSQSYAFWGYQPSLLKTISDGKIQGTEDNYNTHVFKGIPYAAAPINDLRWRAPQDVTPWEGVRDTTEFGSVCAQTGTFWGTDKPEEFATAIGSEDCLFMNVWRPNNYKKNLPVLLWIHGGSNSRGSGSFDAYNGAHLASNANAVVITINFRLGAFGWAYNSFTDNGDPEDASGNYALLDMIKSLEWVQHNIREFGGNPRKVTIAGNSSGCGAVWGLMHSPLANDLFHRAICSGGGPGGLSAEVGQLISDSLIDSLLVGMGLAPDLASAASYRQSQGDAWVADFMRSIPAEILANAVPRSPSNYIDGYVIPELSLESIEAGAYNQVPMIIGSTKNETTMILGFLAGFFNGTSASSPLLWDQLNSDPNTLSATDIINPSIYPLYAGIEDAFSYAWNLSIDNSAANARKHNPQIFRYDFEWDNVPAPWDEALGATHTLDLPFMFGNFITDKDNVHKFAWTEDNKASRETLSDQFMKYIARFMRTGNPNAGWGLPRWKRWNTTSHTHLNTKILLDDPIQGSSEQKNYEEFEQMLLDLDPTSKSIVESLTQGMWLQ